MNRIAKYTASALACVLFTAYVLYHILSGFGKNVQLYTVRSDTFSETISASGYIFRDAETLYSAASGSKSYIYENGEKVSAGSAVAKVSAYRNENAEAELKTINENIKIYTQAAVRAGDSVSGTDEETERIHLLAAKAMAGGDITAAEGYMYELSVLTSKRALLTSGKSDYSSEISILTSRKALIESTLGAGTNYVTAEKSGYYYHTSDGLEAAFSREAALSLTPEGYDLLSAESNAAANTAGSLVRTPEWFFAAKISAETASGLEVGKKYQCRFTDNTHSQALEMTLSRKERSADAKTYLLVFSCSLLPRDFDFMRKQNAEITIKTYSGCKIPASSVRVSRESGETYVYIFKKGFAAVRRVTPVFEKDGYLIIAEGEEIRIYDRLIIGEPDLYEGKMID